MEGTTSRQSESQGRSRWRRSCGTDSDMQARAAARGGRGASPAEDRAPGARSGTLTHQENNPAAALD